MRAWLVGPAAVPLLKKDQEETDDGMLKAERAEDEGMLVGLRNDRSTRKGEGTYTDKPAGGGREGVAERCCSCCSCCFSSSWAAAAPTTDVSPGVGRNGLPALATDDAPPLTTRLLLPPPPPPPPPPRRKGTGVPARLRLARQGGRSGGGAWMAKW